MALALAPGEKYIHEARINPKHIKKGLFKIEDIVMEDQPAASSSIGASGAPGAEQVQGSHNQSI